MKRIVNRKAVQGFFILSLAVFLSEGCTGNDKEASPKTDFSEIFALDGSKNIREEASFGIINGQITTRVHHRDAGTISGLYAPPYASSDFLLEMRLFGEKVRTENYRWYPFEVKREGEIKGVAVETSTVMVYGERAGLLEIHLHNTTGNPLEMPLQLHIQGGLDYIKRWEFARPQGDEVTTNQVKGGRMVRENEHGRIVIATEIPGLSWFALGSRWNTSLTLDAGEKATYHIAFEMGGTNSRGEAADRLLANAREAIRTSREVYADKVDDIFTKLPRFSSDNKQLENYYYRSLAVLLTNRWDVPEFVLQPYYGSGGVLGGCVGNYLWEFGLPAQVFTLFDPEAYKKHIKQFLKIDITNHYLFEPMTGTAGGVWYPVNQDKIIEAIYYYVNHTGDTGFLEETVEGKTIYEHIKLNALFGDDLDQDAVLVDYGERGENHLELRRGYPYRGILPDLNGLRYLTYMRAFELLKLAGKPVHELPERAESVKSLLKKELWSPEDKWFHFIYGDDKRGIRLTNFMYLLIGTGVFDDDIESALLSHLNTEEFLSDYGIHSISKTDSAYDQVDIDHGGGGSYVAFPPIISQRLYNAGYHQEADDLMQRHLWWGERLPYWGDSKVANFMGYRQDSPLQSDFSALSGAQTIIFGLFGIEAGIDGSITINPVPTKLATEMHLEGLKIRGVTVDISMSGDTYQVVSGEETIQNEIGTPTVIN